MLLFSKFHPEMLCHTIIFIILIFVFQLSAEVSLEVAGVTFCDTSIVKSKRNY